MSDSEKRKNAALLYADTEHNCLGLQSYLTKQLAGINVPARTTGRLARATRLNEIIVFCPERQQKEIARLVNDSTVIVQGLKEPVPISARVRGRKWALASWRGGLREATQFDEQSFTSEMVLFARERQIYTAVSVPIEAVLVDPELIDGLLEHHHEHTDEMRFTFSQAAPGLCGCAYRLDMLHELVQAGSYIGELLRYDPESPHADLIVQECNYKVEPELYTSQFRYVADTRRNFDALERLIVNTGDTVDTWNAKQLVAAMAEQSREIDTLPHEVEIEITTEPSLRIDGYPHRQDAGRGRMSLELFTKIVEELGEYDDVCLTIGGFGEPLAHPELTAMIETARSAGIFGINVETDGRLLKDELAEALLKSDADIISVYLDANSEKLYKEVKGQAGFDEIAGQLEAFIEKSGLKGPQVVPHLVKTPETMAEMEEFYDRWVNQHGCAVIVGYNNFAGQIEDKSVMNMAPPRRQGCRRLSRCMSILADGSMTMCGQDFMGSVIIGSVNENGVKDLWRGNAMEELRRIHLLENDFDKNSLCGNCREWHR